MSHYYALLSIVYMICFVALFDCMHVKGWKTRFCQDRLMSQDEVNRVMTILGACEENILVACEE